MEMYGVGAIFGTQLMAEIGDLHRFPRKQSLGIAPAPNDSGDKYGRNSGATKRGSPYLRKTLFNIMKCYLQNAPANEPVFQFVDRKRAEGKPYYVYMTTTANKFLRRYYAKVNEYLSSSENTFLEWGGFATLICYTALLRQAVKDAIGVAIYPWLTGKTVLPNFGWRFTAVFLLYSFLPPHSPTKILILFRIFLLTWYDKSAKSNLNWEADIHAFIVPNSVV